MQNLSNLSFYEYIDHQTNKLEYYTFFFENNAIGIIFKSHFDSLASNTILLLFKENFYQLSK